jgi:hypothetical protein
MSHKLFVRTADGITHEIDSDHPNVCPIYNYHPEYKYFTLQSEAIKDPLEYNIFLAPAHSTYIKPPEINSNEVQLFDVDNQEWSVVVDKRGVYYSTEEDTLGKEVLIYDPTHVIENLTTKQPLISLDEGKVLGWDGNSWYPKDEVQNTVTAQDKLKNLGLTVEDLKILLDL